MLNAWVRLERVISEAQFAMLEFRDAVESIQDGREQLGIKDRAMKRFDSLCEQHSDSAICMVTVNPAGMTETFFSR